MEPNFFQATNIVRKSIFKFLFVASRLFQKWPSFHFKIDKTRVVQLQLNSTLQVLHRRDKQTFSYISPEFIIPTAE